VRAVSVEGACVRVTAERREGEAVLNFELTPSAVHGTWANVGRAGALSGRRRTVSLLN
jgi:hypothetical protein